MLKALLLVLGPVLVFAINVSQLEKQLKKRPEDRRLRQKLGMAYSEKGNSEKVIEVLAPFSNEIDIPSLRALAEAYRAKKDYPNEIQILELYRQREPERFRPHYLLGLALRDNKQLDEAVEFLRRSIRLAPKHRPSFQALLEVFGENNQNYESRILLVDMIGKFGERKEYLNELCRLYIVDSFLKEAQSTCKKALSKNPKFPDNHVHLAMSYLYQEKKKAAEKIFINAARQFKDSEYVQWSAGEYYYQEQNYPIAVRYLKRAVKADKTKARSQLGLALSLFEMGSFKESIPHYLAACKLDKSRVALRAFRTAAAKLRQELHPDSPAFQKVIDSCF